MRFKFTVLIALLTSILLASSVFADSSKMQRLNPAAKTAPAINHQIMPHHSGNLDEVLVSTDFEGGTPPAGWSTIVTNASFTWTTAALSGVAGLTGHDSPEAATCVYDPDLANQNEWLISPAIDMSNTGASYEVSFWWNMSYYWGVSPNDNYDLELRISLDGGTNWETTVVWSEAEEGVFENFEWYFTTVDLSTYAGQSNVALGFRYVGVDGAQAQFDDIVVESIPPGGTLSGTVTDSETSNAIEGATVTVVGEGSFGLTNASGVYTLNNVVPGTYTVNFTHPLYEAASATDVVITLGSTTNQDMSMTALPIIANDDCDNPYAITTAGVYPYSTANATSNGSVAALPDECDEGSGVDFAPDIWVSWTAPSDGSLTVSTCNDADYDTRLACYSNGTGTCPGCPTSNTDFVACNDDADGCSLTSEMVIDVDGGACYLIRVGGYGTATGTGNLTISFEGAPAPILTLDPTSFDFGQVETDDTVDMTLTLENTGAAVLQITSITVPEGYTVTPTAHGIPIGSSRTSTITFAPSAVQTYSGDVTITSNDANSPHTIPITGEGVLDTDVDDYAGVVDEYYVATSFPNPFNPETTISFAIPKSEMVSVVVFNMVGQEVAVLNNGRLDAGIHNFTFNGVDLPSGLYFTRIEADGFTQTLKNVLMK